MRIEPGTRVLVTGASRGIGRAVALAFAARGCRLGLVARSAGELERLAATIGDGAVALVADVGDREAVERAVGRFAEEAGGLEVAVANAGVAKYGPFAELDPERVEEMTRINWLGTVYTVGAALPHLLGQARGHIVVVSSGAAYRAFPWAAAYGATKAAQKGFAEALRHELSGTGVSLTTVFPGEIETSLHAHELHEMPDWYRPGGALPPERVAEAIVAAVERDRRTVHVPGIIRLLGLNALAPGLADRMLRLLRGGSVAPRRD